MSNDAAGFAVLGVFGLFYLVMGLMALAAIVFWVRTSPGWKPGLRDGGGQAGVAVGVA